MTQPVSSGLQHGPDINNAGKEVDRVGIVEADGIVAEATELAAREAGERDLDDHPLISVKTPK